jgi:CheY-like chemotaxis protein
VTLEVLERHLSASGYLVDCATGASMALELLESEPFDLLVTDLKMPGMGGMELVRAARERHPDLTAMMITGYATVPGAVEALQSGVAEYLAKPFTKGELCKAVDRVLEKVRAARAAGPPPGRDPRRRFGLVGASPAMATVFAALERAAASAPAPVLLMGEAGSGRKAAARGLASAGPFLAEPCAALAQARPASRHLAGAPPAHRLALPDRARRVGPIPSRPLPRAGAPERLHAAPAGAPGRRPKAPARPLQDGARPRSPSVLAAVFGGAPGSSSRVPVARQRGRTRGRGRPSSRAARGGAPDAG